MLLNLVQFTDYILRLFYDDSHNQYDNLRIPEAATASVQYKKVF